MSRDLQDGGGGSGEKQEMKVKQKISNVLSKHKWRAS